MGTITEAELRADVRRLLDAAAAQRAGYVPLGAWLKKAERRWREHGKGNMTFLEQIDYFGKLTAQFPPARLRVVYTTHGSQVGACLLRDTDAVVENTLHWIAPSTAAEGRYLIGILNSETTRSRIEHLQSRGQWGARHFVKLMFQLSIPKFDAKNELHRRLAEAAKRAENVAAAVELEEGMHFVTVRKRVREALGEDGVADEIDGLVVQLLDGASERPGTPKVRAAT